MCLTELRYRLEASPRTIMDMCVVRTEPAIAPLDYPAGYHYARCLRRAVAVALIDAAHLASVWHRRSRAPDICRPERPSAFMSPNRDLRSPTGGQIGRAHV